MPENDGPMPERDGPMTDRQLLRESAYSDDTHLATRIETHRRYTVPSVDFQGWVLGNIEWRGGEVVVDVGCGSRSYAAAVEQVGGRYVGMDLSEGMLRSSGPGRVLLGDADRPPFRNACADVLLLCHMLYHVPDVAATARACARMLEPDGVLLAATNASTSMARIGALVGAAVQRLGAGDGTADAVSVERFSLESGDGPLRTVFSSVERRVLDTALVFPDAAPVVRYVNSMGDCYRTVLPAGIAWPDVLREVERAASDEIERAGEYRVGKRAGVFVCRGPARAAR